MVPLWYQDILNHADESNTAGLMELAVVYMPRSILPGTLELQSAWCLLMAWYLFGAKAS